MTWLQSRVVVRDVLELVVQARLYWIGLRDYGKHYENAVAARFIRAAAGHWLFLNASELPCFLPGLNVPKMHLRAEFLIFVDRSANQFGTSSYYEAEAMGDPTNQPPPLIPPPPPEKPDDQTDPPKPIGEPPLPEP